MSDFAKTAQHLLAQSAAKPEETIIVAAVDPQQAMVLTVRCNRSLDLIQVARSLLEDARERTKEELGAEDCNSQRDDPVEQRLSYLMAAIDEISAIPGMDDED
jgi:hypothetical protein